ncbi:MAG: PEP-utilizing enzyme, partial [Candidatus Methylomirabilales bacterium]
GVAIETLFGTPQDVEFAVANGEIFILQARPVPIGREPVELKLKQYLQQEIEQLKERIAELRRKGKLTTSEVIFSSGNIAELLPTPTPMSFGIFTSIFAEEGGIQIGRRRLGYMLGDETSEGLFTLIGGHPYFNLEIDARTFSIGIPLDLQGYIDRVKKDPGLANYPELGLYEQSWTLEEAVARFGPREGKEYYERFLTFLGGMKRHGREYLHRFHREVEPRLQSYWERERALDFTKLSKEEIVNKIQAYLEHLRTFSSVHFVIAARLGFFFAERVKRKLHGWFPREAEALIGELLRGLEQSRIGQMIWDLARLARSEISQERFLAMYGHLATNELEISLPRLADDPRILEHLMKGSGKDPGVEFEEQVERRRRAQEKIRRQLKRAPIKPQVLQELFEELEHAQTYLPLRETVKYYIAAEYALIRKALLILAERLGFHHEEIFYLYPAELPGLLRDLKQAGEKAERRKEERQLALLLSKQKRMPKVIFEGSLEAIGAPPKIEASQEFTGIPVSSGEAVGVVRTLDPEAPDLLKAVERLGDAEIIVTRAANLGMATLIRKAAGLILETGGLLAHGACLARERGIPAVVLANATALLPDGSPVKIDGNAGKVYLFPS